MKLYEITEQLRQLMAIDDVPPEQLQDRAGTQTKR